MGTTTMLFVATSRYILLQYEKIWTDANAFTPNLVYIFIGYVGIATMFKYFNASLRKNTKKLFVSARTSDIMKLMFVYYICTSFFFVLKNFDFEFNSYFV